MLTLHTYVLLLNTPAYVTHTLLHLHPLLHSHARRCIITDKGLMVTKSLCKGGNCTIVQWEICSLQRNSKLHSCSSGTHWNIIKARQTNKLLGRETYKLNTNLFWHHRLWEMSKMASGMAEHGWDSTTLYHSTYVAIAVTYTWLSTQTKRLCGFQSGPSMLTHVKGSQRGLVPRPVPNVLGCLFPNTSSVWGQFSLDSAQHTKNPSFSLCTYRSCPPFPAELEPEVCTYVGMHASQTSYLLPLNTLVNLT